MRDVLETLNDMHGTDFEINTDQVRKAIFNNLQRKADWETTRSKPVNTQVMADSAQAELDKLVVATF